MTQLELFEPASIENLGTTGYYVHEATQNNQPQKLTAAQVQVRVDQMLRSVGLPDYTTCVSTCHYAIEVMERERSAFCSPNSEVDECCTSQTLNLAKKIKRDYNAAHGVIICTPK